MIPDLARIRDDQRESERTLEQNHAALDATRQRTEAYRRALAAAEVQAENARNELRRAGLLRE
jgi:hypothetical protein